MEIAVSNFHPDFEICFPFSGSDSDLALLVNCSLSLGLGTGHSEKWRSRELKDFVDYHYFGCP
jgi:hypothetical protein